MTTCPTGGHDSYQACVLTLTLVLLGILFLPQLFP